MDTKNKYWVTGNEFRTFERVGDALLHGPFDAIFENDVDVVLALRKYRDDDVIHHIGMTSASVEHHRFPRHSLLNQAEHDEYVARYNDIKAGDYVAVMVEPMHPNWVPRLIHGYVIDRKKPDIVYVLTDDGTKTKPAANAKNKMPAFRTHTHNIMHIVRPDEV
jgi:hypothetical protein